MKAFFVKIGKAIKAFFVWLFSIIEDLTTILREGGKGTPFSSRRIFAAVFVVVGVIAIFKGLALFTSLIGGGWAAVLVFVPVALCLVAAIFFSYFASLSDIKDALSEAKDFLTKSKPTV
jgi:fatty acid desaturase